MSSPSKFVFTSSPSQSSRLGDGLALSNTGVGFVCNRLSVEITYQSEEVCTHKVAIEEQKRTKQICDKDQRRFKQLYDKERQSERFKQLCSGQQAMDDWLLETSGFARQRAWKEQQAKDNQLLESSRLARQRAQEEQRAKDDQLLESYRLAKHQDTE
jgi:hypothetical protein